MSLDLSITEFAGKEWMVANGLGGYASGMVDGPPQRRHDGLLVAALEGALGRTVMLDRIDQSAGGEALRLESFRLEDGLPVWTYRAGAAVIERRLIMPHRQNTSLLFWRVAEGGPVVLEIRPWLDMRANDGWLDQPLKAPRRMATDGDRAEITMGTLPPLRLAVLGAAAAWHVDGGTIADAFRAIEADRHYPPTAALWSPGTLTLTVGEVPAILVATTEAWETALALAPAQAIACERERRRRLMMRAHPSLRGFEPALMVLAADSFVFVPTGRPGLTARARALGDDARSVIAGYPWFMDWGRDTMISLEGLTMVTGRLRDSGAILRTFAHYVKDGLIPNNIPDGGGEGVYHAADATLWFFHALSRHVAHSGDRETLNLILPVLSLIAEYHRRGTRFGIRIDPEDGLFAQGEPGWMLTWMDSDTPRRGKAVELNALWYNAMRLLEGWLREAGDAAGAERARRDAERCRESFNRRFWCESAGHLYDIVDGEHGDDASCRPNQLFAISLPHPVLDPARWPAVVAAARTRLLTPVGLRSLAPEHPDYKGQYAGDLHSRDVAYHRGTVWPWLIGPYVDAWLKTHPEDRLEAQRVLTSLAERLSGYCLGTLAEVFDGDAPHAPRGCTAQAWSVAEWLRAWVRTEQEAA
jgi:hypothetical protein